jgi:hypothetical protein
VTVPRWTAAPPASLAMFSGGNFRLDFTTFGIAFHSVHEDHLRSGARVVVETQGAPTMATVYDKRFTPLKFHYLTRSYSVLPVSAVGSTGIIIRMVLPWPSERLAVPVVRVDRYRSVPSRR